MDINSDIEQASGQCVGALCPRSQARIKVQDVLPRKIHGATVMPMQAASAARLTLFP